MRKRCVSPAPSSPRRSERSIAVSKLFTQSTIINVGLSSFADAVVQTGGQAEQVEWTPPAAGDRDVGLALARLTKNPAVDAATEQSFQQYQQAQPVLIGIGTAGKDIPNMGERML